MIDKEILTELDKVGKLIKVGEMCLDNFSRDQVEIFYFAKNIITTLIKSSGKFDVYNHKFSFRKSSYKRVNKN